MNIQDVNVLILAGGLGTRIHDLIGDIPKPMAEFQGRPFLEWIILSLKKNGFRKIILSIGHFKDIIKTYFEDGAKWGMNISYAVESSPLGTGGAIKHSLEKVLSDPFVVMNGDSMSLIDYNKLLKFHFEKKANITICSKVVENVGRFGEIVVDEQGKILSFDEKTGGSGKGLVNAGVYVIKKNNFNSIADGTCFSFEYDLMPKLVGGEMYSFCVKDDFLDIGTPESFKSADDFIGGFKKQLLDSDNIGVIRGEEF